MEYHLVGGGRVVYSDEYYGGGVGRGMGWRGLRGVATMEIIGM